MTTNDALTVHREADLPTLVERAASALANAKTAAEVLDARDMASLAYDVAKKAARFAKAKHAHDDLISAVMRSQADALVIEAMAKRRLADEYDAAQERGEVTTRADQNLLPEQKKVSVSDIGLTHKDVHEAREIRDAEIADPGVVKRAVDEAIANREEPTKAQVRRAVKKVAKRGGKSKAKAKKDAKPSKANISKSGDVLIPVETRHQHDLGVLLSVWNGTCVSARVKFLADQPSITQTPKPDANVIKQAGNFHVELMNYTEEFCARVKAWHAANEIDAESQRCVVQALEMTSMRLQRDAQDIDGRSITKRPCKSSRPSWAKRSSLKRRSARLRCR